MTMPGRPRPPYTGPERRGVDEATLPPADLARRHALEALIDRATRSASAWQAAAAHVAERFPGKAADIAYCNAMATANSDAAALLRGALRRPPGVKP